MSGLIENLLCRRCRPRGCRTTEPRYEWTCFGFEFRGKLVTACQLVLTWGRDIF